MVIGTDLPEKSTVRDLGVLFIEYYIPCLYI